MMLKQPELSFDGPASATGTTTKKDCRAESMQASNIKRYVKEAEKEVIHD